MLSRVVIMHGINPSARINLILNNKNYKFNIFCVRSLGQIWTAVNLPVSQSTFVVSPFARMHSRYFGQS